MLLLRCKEEQKEETSDQRCYKKKEESKQKGGVGNKRQKQPWDVGNVPVRGEAF